MVILNMVMFLKIITISGPSNMVKKKPMGVGGVWTVWSELYGTQKLSPTFLWVSKFDVKLGVGEFNFRNYPIYVSFQIFGSKS